jgi:acyl-coenzyme A synthetase/AMP-(fatty) acid ligase
MYTSGTTGKPKGAIRNHKGGAMLSLVTEVELGISRRDAALLVMPMCHANSLYFFGAFSYCGAACTVYSRRHFDPEHLVRTLAEGGNTFTSLVPTHYSVMLDLPAATRQCRCTSSDPSCISRRRSSHAHGLRTQIGPNSS